MSMTSRIMPPHLARWKFNSGSSATEAGTSARFVGNIGVTLAGFISARKAAAAKRRISHERPKQGKRLSNVFLCGTSGEALHFTRCISGGDVTVGTAATVSRLLIASLLAIAISRCQISSCAYIQGTVVCINVCRPIVWWSCCHTSPGAWLNTRDMRCALLDMCNVLCL